MELRKTVRSLHSRLNKLESEFRRHASRENKNQNGLLERIQSMEEKMNSCQICKHAVDSRRFFGSRYKNRKMVS